MHEIIGHARITNFFSRAITNGQLSHAYCFVGPRHVGKRAVAEHVIRTLLKIKDDHAFIHPDLSIVEREVNEKTGILKKDISIDQVRGLTMRLSQSAFTEGGYSVALIDGAEYLNTAAANALLKTLEEPHQKTLLILIVHNEAYLIKTLRSRCQSIYFTPVPAGDMRVHLENLQQTPEAGVMVRDAHGLPGKLRSFEDASLYGEYQAEVQRALSLVNKPLHEKISRTENLFTETDEGEDLRTRVIAALTVWILAFRDILIGISGSESGLANNQIPVIIDEIEKGIHDIERNINPRLVLENILLHIP